MFLSHVHEMAMVSDVQEAQKDNLRSFNDYMMKVLEQRGYPPGSACICVFYFTSLFWYA
ncbi:hypothetical protein JHK87_043449 [Glycine soja]|nr:hypothetical protein JHK87_043449 [Glycine soja]